ncbi:carbohydrate esterase family 16 protein, partial [Trametes sanguinea]
QKRSKTAQICNLACAGATAEDDLATQLSSFFALIARKASPETFPTDPERTTYFLVFGVNDCGRSDEDELDPIVETIFDAAHDLYVKAGARNFLFIDVPPIHRSPQGKSDPGSSDTIAERVEAWNDLLQAQAAEFGASYKEATTLLFSSHHVLTEVLDDPVEYDLSEEDVDMEGGGVWEDDLHLTEQARPPRGAADGVVASFCMSKHSHVYPSSWVWCSFRIRVVYYIHLYQGTRDSTFRPALRGLRRIRTGVLVLVCVRQPCKRPCRVFFLRSVVLARRRSSYLHLLVAIPT